MRDLPAGETVGGAMGKFIFGLILGAYMGITLMCIIIVSREEKR